MSSALHATLNPKSKGKNIIVLLSTVRAMKRKAKDDQKYKSTIYKFYDFTKDGTVIADQMNDFYSTCAKTSRWSMLAFYYMLDTI